MVTVDDWTEGDSGACGAIGPTFLVGWLERVKGHGCDCSGVGGKMVQYVNHLQRPN